MESYNKPLQVRTKTEAVYAMLKEAIVAGELVPGERIVLRQLAVQLGVSGIPIREAIKQLEAEGLVTVSPHSEVVVAKLSPKEFEELSGIRAVLESYAAGLTAQRKGRDIAGQLQECLEHMKLAVQTNDHRSYGKLDKEFHEILCANCGNEELNKMIQGLANRTERARALFVMDPQRMKHSVLEHQGIFEAITAGGGPQAESAVRKHKEHSFESYYKHQFLERMEETK